MAIYNQLKLCERLLDMRLARGYTQTEMANLLNISQAAYFRTERGEIDVSFSRLVQIATVYGVTVSDLLAGI